MTTMCTLLHTAAARELVSPDGGAHHREPGQRAKGQGLRAKGTISCCWDGRVECRESSERLNLNRALGRGGAWTGSASGGL